MCMENQPAGAPEGPSAGTSAKGYGWLCCGVAAIGAMLGFLTGASNSPVVGTVISGVFGGVLGFVGGFINLNRSKDK